MGNNPRINLQNHLGEAYANRSYNQTIGIYLAKVLRVHHKHNTADVKLVYSDNTISSDVSVEGKFSARITVANAHFDNETMTSSGVIEPIQEGELVMVGFLDDSKGKPVILGSFHSPADTDNSILPRMYPILPENSLEELRESLKYLRVHPSQFYHKVDGIGATEMSHPSGMFLKIDPDMYEEIDDSHEGFDNDSLSEKDPNTGQTLGAAREETAYPVKVLFSHKSDNVAVGEGAVAKPKWTKVFIDKNGEFRLSRNNNDEKLSYFEMTENGGFALRRQYDSNVKGEGKEVSEIAIADNGKVHMSRKHLKGETKIEITEFDEFQIQHSTNNGMIIDQEGNIDLVAKSFRLFSDKDTIVHISDKAPPFQNGAKLWIDTSDL